jgi:hypothetical protein
MTGFVVGRSQRTQFRNQPPRTALRGKLASMLPERMVNGGLQIAHGNLLQLPANRPGRSRQFWLERSVTQGLSVFVDQPPRMAATTFGHRRSGLANVTSAEPMGAGRIALI